MSKINKPVSREMFEEMYLKLAKRAENTEETFFSGINLADQLEESYIKFVNDKVTYDDFIMESSNYEKNKILQYFIENEILSEIYTQSYDIMLVESDHIELSFKQSYLAENTEKLLNVKYKGVDVARYNLLEEGWTNNIGIAGIGAMIGAMIHSLPVMGISAILYFGISLLLPVKWLRVWEDKVQEYLGTLGVALFGPGTGDRKNNSYGKSTDLMYIFDNIDANPEIKKLFRELQKTGSKKEVLSSLSGIVSDCIEDNKILNNEKIDDNTLSFFKRSYNPRNASVFKTLLGEYFKDSNSDKNISNSMIHYRKCVITKMIDMYKILMITNLSENKDYKKIMKSMDKGFNGGAEHLLSFMPETTEHEQELKTKIFALVKLRMEFHNLAEDLKKGSFDIDKEAGTFFVNALKQCDREIEEYLQRNKRRIDTIYESWKENEENDIKGNKKPEKDMKRSFLNL